MAEIKNSFLSSKMNKDLDDRLVPNSEYREALNISVGKSEGDSMGVAQTILGNSEIKNNDGSELETNTNLTCIGSFSDNKNNRIYQFLTDYTDSTPSLITLPGAGKEMKITVYDPSASPVYRTLVSGIFLNFSKTNIITGVNLVEDLLFFTDNRNQPRKINVASASNIPNYYYNEAQISVAKYAPIEPISLIRKVTAEVSGGSGTTYTLSNIVGPVTDVMKPGATMLAYNTTGTKVVSGSEYIFVKSFSGSTVTLYTQPSSLINAGYKLTFLNSTMTNQADTPGWPGDPSFIEDKFVRFSYRFKFDDNEYSLLAPFTQIAYIPKQKGFFINGNEADAYRSTVVNWFENNSNNIELLVPFPDKCSLVADSYKISDLEILYKESDSNAGYVIDSIPASSFTTAGNSNIYIYNYQSQKPYKTLNPDQITRVYDNVPVRALAQEISGNRVIYGNFHTTYAAPREIDYNTSVTPKQDLFDSFIEYPNHTVKQNRNYQVGFILSDKFGRSSSVILSSVDAQIAAGLGSSLSIGGSTLYAPYQSDGQANFPDPREWFGNALTLLINKEISSVKDIPNGTPGLYAIPASNTGFSIVSGATINVINTPTNNYYKYTFTLNTTSGIVNVVPVAGDYLRGKYTDYVKVFVASGSGAGPYIVYTDSEINDLYLFDSSIGGVATKYAYTINEIGWYSYKVVVKQQQQDYYNVYLPGMLQGYPDGQTYGSQVIYTGATESTQASTISYNGINTTDFPVGEANKTSHIVLINDNINKVPRDLTEVGPDQKQYRSSVSLFGKVQNTSDIVDIVSYPTITNRFADRITYNTADQLNNRAFLIKIGDGIQCDGANEPYEVTPPTIPPSFLPNPDRWYANTVVTSHTIIGTTGTITFSPDNITQNSTTTEGTNYNKFTITRAENTQYFPTRKGDVVSSIATARDFNFLENDVNNIKGTASINFYQNQTNPLIGRVATFSTIGVPAASMIPFLSVYETTPDVSVLALFWETATTGYISDVNWDVLTGFDGPSRLSPFDFNFWEDQDHLGNGEDEGEPNSKYITSAWSALNATGLPLTLDSIQLTNVTPDNSTNLPKFAIETDGTQYRLYIKDYFVFNHGAATNSNFTFEITATYNGIQYPLYISGRLKNRPPSFTLAPSEYNKTVGKVVADVVTMTAVNGSATTNAQLKIQDLSWDITAGNSSNPLYFSIETTTGIVKLINATIPVGVYELTIRVRDAMNLTTPLNDPSDIDLSTKEAFIDILITVGEKPVNTGLSYFNTEDIISPDTDSFVWNRDHLIFNGSQQINCLVPASGYLPGQGFGAIYIGAQNITLDATGKSPNLPNYPDNAVQAFVNVEIENGKAFNSPNQPTGLTQGELEFSITNFIEGNEGENRTNKASAFIYYRPLNSTGAWTMVRDTNGVFPSQDPTSSGQSDNGLSALAGQPATNPVDFNLTALSPNYSPVYSPTRLSGEKTIKFVVNTPGEYCLILKNNEYINEYVSGMTVDGATFYCNDGTQAGMNVIVRDANYLYEEPEPNPGPPSPPTPIKYFVSGREYSTNQITFPGYPVATPYLDQDATRGLGATIPAAVVSLPANQIVGNNLYLSASNYQLVKGMLYKGTTVTASGASSSSATITVTSTSGLVVGMRVTIAAGSSGSGNLQVDTVITNINNGTQFSINKVPTSVLSGRTLSATNAYFSGSSGAVITDFEASNTTLVLSTEPTLISGGIPTDGKVAFGFAAGLGDVDQDGFNRGIVYATTDNPLNIKQFFTDINLSTPWYPPVADKAYVFQTDLDYNTYRNDTTEGRNLFFTGFIEYTSYPFFSAFINSQGKIIAQTVPGNTVVTSWGKYVVGGLPPTTTTAYYPYNRGRNMSQKLSVYR